MVYGDFYDAWSDDVFFLYRRGLEDLKREIKNSKQGSSNSNTRYEPDLDIPEDPRAESMMNEIMD